MSLNVGILGHVDAGKTTLTRAIAELASTAAFDKHADKGGRRNTLDLGFSCCFVGGRRLALIDCPGHSGLIRAVLAASSVFDMAIVVVDASCGIQPQTAEHLLLCSIFCPNYVTIVLNKIDLVKSDEIPLIVKRLRKGLKSLGILEESPVIPLTLNPPSAEQIKELMLVIESKLYHPARKNSGKLLVAIDHCFPIKGQGSVLTGTVIDGEIKLNQDIEIPNLKIVRKVKGLESWKNKQDSVAIGERAAILVQNLQCDLVSRTMICSPSDLKEVRNVVCSVNPISFYKGTISTGSKIHISMGFETVMADCLFLKLPEENQNEYEQLKEMSNHCIVILSFEKPIYLRPGFFYIGSKLDHQGKGCRFAFFGQVNNTLQDLSTIRRFMKKQKTGLLERIENDRSAICDSLFKKETNLSIFENMIVLLSTGEVGKIESGFGKKGKVRISFNSPIKSSTITALEEKQNVTVSLYLKKYLNEKKIVSYVPEYL